MMGSDGKGKPQGATGPLVFGPGGIDWAVIEFPASKADRELLIGELFFRASSNAIRCERLPSLRPFSAVRANPEDDLDLTVTACGGERLMELAEFAPLGTFGRTFADAPTSVPTSDKAAAAEALVRKKSRRQGAAGRLLLLYTTEHAFELSETTIELLRRRLAAEPPAFDRVYYLNPVTAELGIAHELYPGSRHHWFGELDDDALARLAIVHPHPRDMRQVRSISWEGGTDDAGSTIRYTVTYDELFDPAAGSESGRDRRG